MILTTLSFMSLANCDEPSTLRIIGARTNFEHADSETDAAESKSNRPLSDGASAGPCVLLHNGNVLYGHASQLGEWVIVARDDLSEVQLSRKEVACWAESIRDLYQYRVDRRGEGTLTERLADAQWCLQHDLFDLVAVELIEIYRIAPHHAEARRIEQRLRSLAGNNGPELSQVEAKETEAIEQEPPWLEQTLAAPNRLHDFARFVQPLLVNRCGQCHDDNSSRNWRLQTPSVGSRLSSRMTGDNFKATLLFLDMSSPLSSELLLKAQTPHGGEPTNVDPRRSVAAATIYKWIRSVRASLPQGLSQESVSGESSTVTEGGISHSSRIPTSHSEAGEGEGSFMRVSHMAELPETKSSDKSTTKPQRLPEIANPFDPELFNRRYGTEANGPSEKKDGPSAM